MSWWKMTSDIQVALIDRISHSDRPGAIQLIDLWLAEHDYEKLLIDVLGPVLTSIGDMWQGEDFSLAHAYVAAKIVEDALEKYESLSPHTEPLSSTRGPVVLGNIEDDCHPLGRRMVTTFLRAQGWEVADLGIDVLPESFVDKAEEIGARVIGVSAMIYSTAENIIHVREAIDRRGLGNSIRLAVGGAVFRLRPELVKEVGGDGTVSDALDAHQLFCRLWQDAGQGDE
ncbi:MAG: cobalamin-dependent protein [Candidatus Thiodiazotropha sp. (ex Dulcina madagascariensis)]|nr:cobalamin-dependent protein [Candidatus Thiodiazotropha sp. (ex Dulcina madagascariensis)]